MGKPGRGPAIRPPAETAAALKAIWDESVDERRSGKMGPNRKCLAMMIRHLRGLGWTLQGIGDALGITRESVRLYEARADQCWWPPDAPAPKPAPTWLGLPGPPKRFNIDLPEEDVRRLKRLYVKARHVNGATPADHPNRRASRQLAKLLNELVHERHYPAYRVAKAMGITHGAIRFRLSRHGYMKGTPSQAHLKYRGKSIWERTPEERRAAKAKAAAAAKPREVQTVRTMTDDLKDLWG